MQPTQSKYKAEPETKNPPAKATKPNKNSTQNTLKVAEIRDGLVIMHDGSYRAVVMAQSINFDLMSPQEREAVENSYQGFLNSLNFPVQIQIRSFRVDMKSYMRKLNKVHDEQDNVLLAILIEDYIAYIDYLTESSNIMDKQFFLIIPYYPKAAGMKANAKKSKRVAGGLFGKRKGLIYINEAEFKQTKLDMKHRVTSVLESMNQMNVQAVPLNTQELIELFYNAYNPDTATVQKLANFADLDAEVITQGEGDAPRASLSDI